MKLRCHACSQLVQARNYYCIVNGFEWLEGLKVILKRTVMLLSSPCRKQDADISQH